LTDLPNVVVVVFDTMRRNVLGAYGGPASSPSIDALAAEGVVYGNCIASSPWTTPSHASLFTGLLPSKHGVHEDWDTKMLQVFSAMKSVQSQPLASYLGERGYETACYSANANIAPGSGFENGFSTFEYKGVTPPERSQKVLDMARKHGRTRREIASNLLKEGKVGDLARLYLEDRRLKGAYRRMNYPLLKGGDAVAASVSGLRLERPFFLFVNLVEMHEPYLRGEPGAETKPIADLFGTRRVSDSMIAAIRRRYVEEAAAADTFFGRILAWLKETGAYGDSLVVATSDHGQSLKEKGFYGHGTFLHDEILEVPLVVKYPGGARPKPGPGHQPLHRVQEMVKDCLVGVCDGSSLTTDHAVAESFGVPNVLRSVSDAPDFEANRARFDRPRKAVYKGALKLVVEGKGGGIEEFSRAGKPIAPGDQREELKEMVRILAEVGDRGFILPA
jgi:arylsulfatase A-like enzyme